MDKLGTSWEFRGKNLELLQLIVRVLQKDLGTSWELRGKNLGKSPAFYVGSKPQSQ